MPKYPKNYKDASYYVPGRKRPIAGSTTPTCIFLAMMHEEHPDLTIRQLRELLTDKTKYLLNREAIAVLDAHIAKGYGDRVPHWSS